MTHEPQIPDKCDFCGLRVYYEHTLIERLTATTIDNDFGKLHELKRLGIIENVPPRKMLAVIGSNTPEYTSFCAVNSSAWSNRQQSCQYWTLKIKDATVADHLAIYHSQRNHSVAIAWAVAAIVVAVVLAIASGAT